MHQFKTAVISMFNDTHKQSDCDDVREISKSQNKKSPPSEN